jgi:hypothetical protein
LHPSLSLIDIAVKNEKKKLNFLSCVTLEEFELQHEHWRRLELELLRVTHLATSTSTPTNKRSTPLGTSMDCTLH